jgi:hypothetical protein
VASSEKVAGAATLAAVATLVAGAATLAAAATLTAAATPAEAVKAVAMAAANVEAAAPATLVAAQAMAASVIVGLTRRVVQLAAGVGIRFPTAPSSAVSQATRSSQPTSSSASGAVPPKIAAPASTPSA